MRGGVFHNKIVEDARQILIHHGWQVFTEHRYSSNDVITYLDIFAVKGNNHFACEIETTSRHVLDNAAKAQNAGISLWFIVPTRKLARQAKAKLLNNSNINHKVIKVLLPDQLKSELRKNF